MVTEAQLFNLLSAVGLVAALILLLILTVRVAGQKRRVFGSLKFQMSLVVGIWLLSELPELIFPMYSQVGGYYIAEEAAELWYETIHFTSMILFAVFMTWRALKFLR